MTKKQKLENHRKTKGYLEKKDKKEKKRFNKALWRETRLKVLERDDWTCQGCGKDLRKTKPGAVAIHHIIPRQYKELFFNENNLITLCSSCHHWSKNSPHQNALCFNHFLQENFFERWDYLMSYMDYEHIVNGKELKKFKEEEKLNEIDDMAEVW